MTAPSVSVICPTHNRSEAIVPTIESVLAQTVQDIELIVVFDGCTDDTEEIVRAIAASDDRVAAIAVERHGHPSGPRNIAVEQATAPFIAYIDHDDVWAPQHLATLLDVVGDDEIAAVAADLRHDDGTVEPRQPLVAMCWHPELQLVAPLFRPSSILHRAGVVERVGGWSVGPGLEDWDLWVRLADAGANIATSTAYTVTARVAPTTRIHRVARRTSMTIGDFDRAPDAAACATSLRELAGTEQFNTARCRDTVDWYRRIAGDARFRSPTGWHPDRLVDDLEWALAADPSTWLDDILVRPTNSGCSVLAPLWCRRDEHARQIAELHPMINGRQQELVGQVVRSNGGVVATSPTSVGVG